MDKIIEWVRGHPWETASAVLGAGLTVAVVSLFVVAGDEPSEEAVATTTTTTTAPTTTLPSAATTTTTADDDVTPTTEPEEEPSEGVTAVVVDNVADVGFQVGLNGSDLIIETPVEGGLSRFTAFYGEEMPGLVGPVRSLRPVSADLLAPFGPVVFTTGGQPFVAGAVAAAGASLITPDESIAFQSLERPQPHHVFVSPETEGHQSAAFVAPWVEGEWSGGETANEVGYQVAGGVTWRYEDDAWVRYRGEEPQQVQSDLDSDPNPLSRQTVILLVANQKSAGYTDSNDVDVPTFDVVGGGDLYVLHAGEAVEGTWFRPSQAEGYTFSDGDGNELAIPAGSSYLGIVPEASTVDIGG